MNHQYRIFWISKNPNYLLTANFELFYYDHLKKLAPSLVKNKKSFFN